MKRFAAITWLLSLVALFAAIPAADATLINTTGARHYTQAAASSEWADVYVATSGVAAELATANRVVGIDGTTVDDWAPNIQFPDSGCAIVFEAGGAYDGENSVQLVPPDSGVQPADCGIIGNNLTNGGANDIAQVNIRFVVVVGPRYIDLASSAKWLCVGISATPGGSRANRACSFDNYEPDISLAGGRIWSVTADEVQSWHEPEIAGCFFWDCGTDDEKGFIVRSTAAHSGTPPVAGPNEPIYFEYELDVRQNRGNANGRSRLYIQTRDGLIDRTIDIPLTWCCAWDFGGLDQIIEIEGLGWYFNTPGTAHADNWIRFSHIAVSANRAVSDPIGPPPGFNTGFLLLLIVQLSWLRHMLKRIIFALLLLSVGMAHAVTYDNSTANDCTGDSTPNTAAFTVGSGSDRYMIGFVYWEGGATISNPAFGAQTPTAHITHANGEFVMYRLDDPTSGSQAFSVQLSAGPSRCVIAALTFSGVASLGTGVQDIVEAGTTLDVDVSSATNDLVVDGAVFANSNITVGASQTPRQEIDDFGSTFRSFGSSTEPGAATVTMSWTTSGASDGFILAANLVNAGAAASALPKIIQQLEH